MESRLRSALWLVLLVATAAPAAGFAQTVRSVEGQVQSQSGERIVGATVALEGVGFRITDQEGRFRFGAVTPRAYALRAEAIGYEPLTLALVVDEDDVTLTVALAVSPVQLDSLVVETRTIDVEGRVWDPTRDIPVPAADVISNQDDPTRTSWGGRFEVRAGQDTDVRLQIRAFRYLPIDTTIAATRDLRHEFRMQDDSLVLRMIDAEVARLGERMRPQRAVGMPAMDRADLIRWSGASVSDLLRARYPRRGRRVACVILDERDVGSSMVSPTLTTTLADEVERIEFLYGGGMLRIYTREFMRKMIGGGLPLVRPTMVLAFGPPLCR